MSEHTPTPWKTNALRDALPGSEFALAHAIYNADDTVFICTVDAPDHLARKECSEKVRDANARFIVKACNCHDELLDLAKHLTKSLKAAVESNVDLPDFDAEDHVLIRKARRVIAQAEGKE